MSHDKLFPARIRYEYCEKPNTQLEVAHGVWGGVNPHGEIELNFYSESDAMPSFSERAVGPDGTLGPELGTESDVRCVKRTVHTKLLLNPRAAYSIFEWLAEKLESVEADEAILFMDDDTGTEQ